MLAVRGEFDAANKRAMHAALEGALAEERAVVVDLTGVRFMDSTGLALMLNAARRLTRRRLGFAIVCPDGGPVRRAFNVAGLEDCFKIMVGVEDAVAEAQPAFSG